MWYANATPNFSGYIPIYAQNSLIPEIFTQEGLIEKNAWQLSKELQIKGDKNYDTNNILAQIFWKTFESELQSKMNHLESQVTLENRSELMNKFTYSAALDLLRKQSSLLKALSEN